MSCLPSSELRGICIAVFVALLTAAAPAQPTPADEPAQKGMAGGCESFKWPLDTERAAFEDAALEQVASGAARGAFKEQAFALALAPVADVAFALPPAKKRNDGFGGVVAFAAPEKAGTYQVTLGSEGWIDLVQDGGTLDATDHSGSRSCPGLRKSVRFDVGAVPVVLQISGAPADSIKVAIRPVD